MSAARRALPLLAPLALLCLSLQILCAPEARAQAQPAQQAPAQQARLQPFEASYLWYWHGAPIAFSRVSLQHQSDDLWVYSSTTRPRGIGRLYPLHPDLESLMRVMGDNVEPLHFKATGGGRGHDSNLSFDWQQGHATGLYEGTNIDLPITPGAQDDLSVQIAILAKLLAGRTPDRLLEIAKDGVRDYDYQREGEEPLDTALGRIDTTVYSSHHAGSPRTTRFWCAPSLGYIPLQVQQRRGSDIEWTMKIRSLVRAP